MLPQYNSVPGKVGGDTLRLERYPRSGVALAMRNTAMED